MTSRMPATSPTSATSRTPTRPAAPATSIGSPPTSRPAGSRRNKRSIAWSTRSRARRQLEHRTRRAARDDGGPDRERSEPGCARRSDLTPLRTRNYRRGKNLSYLERSAPLEDANDPTSRALSARSRSRRQEREAAK